MRLRDRQSHQTDQQRQLADEAAERVRLRMFRRCVAVGEDLQGPVLVGAADAQRLLAELAPGEGDEVVEVVEG